MNHEAGTWAARRFRPHGVSLFVLLFLMAPSSLSTLAAQSVLQWKLASGQSIAWESRSTVTSTRRVLTKTGQLASNTKALTTRITMIVNWGWRVERVQSAQSTIQLRVRRIRLSMNSGDGLPASAKMGKPLEYDSEDVPGADDSPALREVAAPLAKMIGVDFQLQLDSRGQVVSFQSSGQGNAAKPPAALAELVRSTLPQLPEDSVRLGSQWEDQGAVGNAGEGAFRVQRTFQLQQSKNGLANVAVTGKVSVARPADPAAAATQPRIARQSLSGYFRFDPSAGRLTEFELRQQLLTQRLVQKQIEEVATTSTMRTVVTRE